MADWKIVYSPMFNSNIAVNLDEAQYIYPQNDETIIVFSDDQSVAVQQPISELMSND